MGTSRDFLWLVMCVLLFLEIKNSESCDYAFSNLDASIFVDWSTNVGTVVYTVEVSILSKIATPDVVLGMLSKSTNFQLNASDTHQVLLKECLTFGSAYSLMFSIPSDDTCATASLTIVASAAIPIYDVESTEIITTVDMSLIFDPFAFAFRINITNDAFYGGCGDFACTTLHLNDGKVQLLYDTYEYYFTARKSEIVFGFTYNVEIKCLDNADQSFVTEGHTIVVNLTFVELTTPGTPFSTTVQATSFLTPSVAPTTTVSLTSTDLSTTPGKPTTLQQTTTHVPFTTQVITSTSTLMTSLSTTPVATTTLQQKTTTVPFTTQAITSTSALKTSSSATPETTTSLQQTTTTDPFTTKAITSTSALMTSPSTTRGSTTIQTSTISETTAAQTSTNSKTPNVEIVTPFISDPSTISSTPLTALISSSSGGTGISSMVTTASLFSAVTSTQSNQTMATSSSSVVQIPNDENDENFFSSTRNMAMVISGSALVFLGLVLLGLYSIYRKTKRRKKEQKVQPVLLTYSDA